MILNVLLESIRTIADELITIVNIYIRIYKTKKAELKQILFIILTKTTRGRASKNPTCQGSVFSNSQCPELVQLVIEFFLQINVMFVQYCKNLL